MREPQNGRLIVLGAGITGLCAAYEAVRRAAELRRRVEVLVLEAAPRMGGKVVTESREGFLIEGGPDSFVSAKPDLKDLACELGLSADLVDAAPPSRAVYVYSGGRLHALPSGQGFVPRSLLPWLTSKLLSWPGKMRMGLEPFVPRLSGEDDESLGSFVRRRLGAEALEKFVGPILAGIHAGDPERLSLQCTFPQLRELERRGGLLRGTRGGSAPAASFTTVKGGLGRVIEALAARLPRESVRLGERVMGLRRRGGRWQVHLEGGETVCADAVVSALPAPALAGAVADLDLELSCILREIPFVSTASVTLGYEGQGFPRAARGFGFVVPRSEGLRITAGSFSSSKFAHRAPEGQVLIRCFIGGAGREEAAEADDAALARSARQELRLILGLDDRHPKLSRVHRWTKANPQYVLGHPLRLKRLQSCLRGHPGLVLAGSSYEGVGLPDCVRSGRRAGRRAAEALVGRRVAGVA